MNLGGKQYLSFDPYILFPRKNYEKDGRMERNKKENETQTPTLFSFGYMDIVKMVKKWVIFVFTYEIKEIF